MAKKLNKSRSIFSATSFSADLHNILQGRSLYINRESMNIKQLELLINNGFKMENGLLEPFYEAIASAKLRMEEKFDREKDITEEDAEIITRWGGSYR
jgi:hypothetical protein